MAFRDQLRGQLAQRSEHTLLRVERLIGTQISHGLDTLMDINLDSLYQYNLLM